MKQILKFHLLNHLLKLSKVSISIPIYFLRYNSNYGVYMVAIAKSYKCSIVKTLIRTEFELIALDKFFICAIMIMIIIMIV